MRTMRISTKALGHCPYREVQNIHSRAYAWGVLWYGVNPVPRTYVRGFGALPFGEVQNIHPVRLWSGVRLISYGVHPRAYPDPTNKKNLNAFLGRVF